MVSHRERLPEGAGSVVEGDAHAAVEVLTLVMRGDAGRARDGRLVRGMLVVLVRCGLVWNAHSHERFSFSKRYVEQMLRAYANVLLKSLLLACSLSRKYCGLF